MHLIGAGAMTHVRNLRTDGQPAGRPRHQLCKRGVIPRLGKHLITHQYFIFCPGVYLFDASTSALRPALASRPRALSAAANTAAFSSLSLFQKMGSTITCSSISKKQLLHN